jgi:hypothetical protein
MEVHARFLILILTCVRLAKSHSEIIEITQIVRAGFAVQQVEAASYNPLALAVYTHFTVRLVELGTEAEAGFDWRGVFLPFVLFCSRTETGNKNKVAHGGAGCLWGMRMRPITTTSTCHMHMHPCTVIIHYSHA